MVTVSDTYQEWLYIVSWTDNEDENARLHSKRPMYYIQSIQKENPFAWHGNLDEYRTVFESERDAMLRDYIKERCAGYLLCPADQSHKLYDSKDAALLTLLCYANENIPDVLDIQSEREKFDTKRWGNTKYYKRAFDAPIRGPCTQCKSMDSNTGFFKYNGHTVFCSSRCKVAYVGNVT